MGILNYSSLSNLIKRFATKLVKSFSRLFRTFLEIAMTNYTKYARYGCRKYIMYSLIMMVEV